MLKFLLLLFIDRLLFEIQRRSKETIDINVVNQRKKSKTLLYILAFKAYCRDPNKHAEWNFNKNNRVDPNKRVRGKFYEILV